MSGKNIQNILHGERLHHAYCVTGAGVENVAEFAEKIRTVFGIERGSPDVVALAVPSFGIDDALEFRRWAENRAVSGGKKFFVFGVDSITHEAQNALLKTFEEPTPHTHFFLLIKNADMLLPTLYSRVEVVSAEAAGISSSERSEKEAKEFLASSVEKRLARAEKITKALKDEKMTRGEAAALISDMVETARGTHAFPRAYAEGLEHLVRAEEYARDKSASLKIILEHLAVVLPKM